MKSVIAKNIAGNFYGIGVNLLSQIILVPFFISYWGVELYADWIALTAITSFFSMSDIGLNTVTANQYSMFYSKSQFSECNSLLANNFLLILIMWSLSLLCCAVIMNIVEIGNVMNLHVVSSKIGSIVLLLLISKIYISMLGSVYAAIYRARSVAYKTFFISNTVRLIDALTLLLGILFKMDLIFISFLYCMTSILQLLFYSLDTSFRYKVNINIKKINLQLFKSLLLPSLSFMSFPLGYAIIMQGNTLIVNKYFGADCVVLYNTTRTICNFLKVVPNAIKNATWPEFTIAYAKKNTNRMKQLYQKTIFISLTFVVLSSVFLLICGDYIYQIWTNNAVTFSFSLMFAYMTTIFFNSIWETSGMTLMATNKHTKLGILFVLFSAISFFLALIIAPNTKNLIAIVLCVLLVDFSLSVYSLRNSKKIIYNL